ncbi:condensin-2 complex subunit H2 isoform X1 [Pyrgilauda ruficollis]|uniref:condensin-2 complex subunit H2 isoform X1 n=1 Tax=Pyrgilauda ruficollis TaxID=221976 RepID=UPI001B85D292|nr:condensin-2 complex subunit H2 isoform X1 [Pyrgilauda ruficollis]
MEEVDSRFLHLLQPIRDLTKNWEVDVAAQLGEYLEELDQICISFDNGRTTMNFMEAALLIQGSACIYSRKVEYLYMLVCQTLDCISKKKKEKLPTSLGPDGRDADATFTDKEEEFLSLDDIPETSQASVDMRRDQQPAAVNIVPLTPMSLVPPEEGEKKENPLLSRRGEVLASRRDFRMNTSTPHACGAFLLELAGLSPTHPQQEQCLGTATAAPGSSPAERPSSGTALARALSFCEEAGPEDDDVPGALEDDMEVTPVPKEHIVAQRSTPRTRGYVLRERPPSPDPKALSKEEPNPWQSLDPFGDSEEKPFRKGRPFQVPHGLDDVIGGKRKRRGPRKLQDFTRWFSAAYNNVTERQKSRRRGPTFADLEVLYWRHFKERLAARRKLQSRGVLLRESEPELEQERGADSEEGEDDDFVEHEDMEPEAPEELEEENLDPPEPGYEELVRRNVELFMASSQKFAQETELSQRIRQWEERMEPLLQEQESRVAFDVRAYGQQLTERCAELGQWHSLASLVAGQPPFEVCRYLLASLQLANDEEVELAQEPGLEAALDTARLRLISARPAHERFQQLQLPSQRDPGPQ